MTSWVRRNTELGLIVLGAVITAGLYVLASIGRTASLPANIIPFLLIVLALLAAGHLAMRRLAPGADGVLLPIAGLLNGIGYVMIARLDQRLAGLQATWTLIGVAAFIGTLIVVRRVRDLERYRYTFMLLGVGLLLLPLLPGIGRNINGARIWVSLGPLNFQPGEFAKIALAIFFASYLVEKREVLGIAARRVGPLALPEIRHFGPVLLAWAASLLVMVAEKDLGSSLLFFALFITLLWVATERASYLAVGLVMFSAGAVIAWRVFAHVQERVDIWLHPFADPSGSGYQVVQATFALAWGGIAGTGLGLGNPGRIPAAATDFIFAAIGEELGLLGSAAIVVAFLLMVGAGLRIALRADSPFETLLATGLTTILGVQAFIIMGGVIRLVPLTGITLPFVSYGGSSLVANYILLALLLRISAGDAAAAPAPGADDETTFGTLRR
ncbi:MAG: putative FtsW/RodA/SpoVE family cell cycle protein [Acidimicrobiales bacterium]|nr:putative FtsW/RodA/SpoVE family cell cycle protein [Acidimicrobiales bacterium]